MLRIYPGIPGKGALYIPELILQGAQTSGSGNIPIGKVLQIPTTAGNIRFNAFQLLLPLRQEHVAIVYQAFELLGKVIPNLLVYYFYQLVRETDRAYIALLHWVSLLCSFV